MEVGRALSNAIFEKSSFALNNSTASRMSVLSRRYSRMSTFTGQTSRNVLSGKPSVQSAYTLQPNRSALSRRYSTISTYSRQPSNRTFDDRLAAPSRSGMSCLSC